MIFLTHSITLRSNSKMVAMGLLERDPWCFIHQILIDVQYLWNLNPSNSLKFNLTLTSCQVPTFLVNQKSNPPPKTFELLLNVPTWSFTVPIRLSHFRVYPSPWDLSKMGEEIDCDNWLPKNWIAETLMNLLIWYWIVENSRNSNKSASLNFGLQKIAETI